MSPSPSDVAVVTVNWNGRAHLETLLPTVQKTGCGEIIVVDNGSSDGSQDLVTKRFPAVRIIQNDSNHGFAHPCNQAASQVQRPYLAFINNDMRVDPGWLRQALPRLDQETVCVGSRILDWSGERVDYNGSSLQYLGYALQEDIGKLVEDVSCRSEILFPCGGAMLIERDVFLQVGGFDADYFAIFEDVDLGWRLWLLGYRVALAPDSIACHRGHATLDTASLPKVRYLMHRNALFTILKNYDDARFEKILPLAVSMAIKRAVLFSGVQKETFYFWSDVEARLEQEEAQMHSRLLDSLNHLVAVDDVLECLPEIMRKRHQVQAGRRRSDEEVFQFFRDPFRPIVEDPEYALHETAALQHLDFTETAPSRHLDLVRGVPDRLKDHISRLRNELACLEWIAGHQLGAPPPRPASGLGRLLRILTREGPRGAWRRLQQQVKNGL